MNRVIIQIESVSDTGYIITMNPGSVNCSKEVVTDDNMLVARLGNAIKSGLVIKANSEAVQIAAVSRPVPKGDRILKQEEQDSIDLRMDFIAQENKLLGFEGDGGIIYYGDQADYIGRILEIKPDKVKTRNGEVSLLLMSKYPDALKRLSAIPNIKENIRKYDDEDLKKQVSAVKKQIIGKIEEIQQKDVAAANRKMDEENKKKQKKGKK